MFPAWDTLASILRCALWADVQAALWSVLLLTAAALAFRTIVLPEALVLGAGSCRSLRAVLAHELAHARAADPFIQRLLGLLRCFLPLTWLCALGASRAGSGRMRPSHRLCRH